MGVPGSANFLLAGSVAGYRIERSLRFNSADSAYLTRPYAASGNRRLHTYSFWVKRSSFGSRQSITGNTNASGQYGLYFEFNSDDTLLIGDYGNGWLWQLSTTAQYRDPSAWYHIVLAIDTANATASNRAKLYVNGIQNTAFSTANYMAQNYDTYTNYVTYSNNIGRLGEYNGQYFNGLITEYYFIDAQALSPSSFGETDGVTGAWKPKKYSGAYGTTGFYLNFSDNSGITSTTLGKDSSGLGNNWTPNNFSVTAGAGNDSLIDTPTPYADGGNGRGNYATWNPLKKNSGVSFSNGNLDFSGPGTAYPVFGNIAMTTGKWYWENLVNSNDGGDYPQFGVVDLSANENDSSNLGSFRAIAYRRSGVIFKEGTQILSGRPTFTNGDVISVAFDANTGKVWFAKNGTWVNGSSGSAGDPAAGTNEVGSVSTAIQGYVAGGGGYSSATFSINFGQRPFAYTPPSGFVALNTQNLPEPSIKKPNQYFDATTYAGTGGQPQTVTNAGAFQPDFIWIKNRSTAGYGHSLQDSVRGFGTSKKLRTDTTSAEGNATYSPDTSGYVSAVQSNGFQLTFAAGGDARQTHNSNDTYVAWQWKESATPGFDIVTYTGNATARTISHSLGVAPSFIIVKNRSNGTANWQTGSAYHNATSPWNYYMRLNSTGAAVAASTIWNNTAPTSSVFSVGTDGEVNGNGDNMIAYLWSEVAGFSKFGSYTGNGSTDGPFVFCGFRPRFILFKNTTDFNWQILDTARANYNQGTVTLFPNLSNAENTTATQYDILSNGFKIRTSDAGSNGSGNSIIFAAFAEAPFKYALAR